MRPASHARWLDRLCRLYSVMLLAYPAAFRREFGREMAIVFRTQARAVMRTGGIRQLLRFMLGITRDWMVTTLQQSKRMAGPTHTLRWVAVLPLAILAGGAALRIVGFLTPIYMGVFDGFHRVWAWTSIGCFLMATAFVSVGVWVAPSQKDSVARIALGVVICGGVLFMALGAVALAVTPVVWGLSTLFGGVVGYLFWRPPARVA